MSMNLITLLYLVASICFIQALKGLSHPTSSRQGNLFGMVGMGIAVVTTTGVRLARERRLTNVANSFWMPSPPTRRYTRTALTMERAESRRAESSAAGRRTFMAL